MEYRGSAVSSGIAIGSAYIYKPYTPEITEKTITPDSAESAIADYINLRAKAQLELEVLKEKLKHSENPEKADIIGAQITMLNDVAMNSEIEKRIRNDLISPECAIDKVYAKFIRLLSKSKDQQIRERVADLQDIKTRLCRIWFNVPERNLASLENEVIIIAHDLYPSDTVNIDRPKVLAIVTEVGGSTSHTAIIARSYEIPAVLGVTDVMTQIADGETLVVDAVDGVVHTNVDDKAIKHFSEKRTEHLKRAKEIEKYINAEPVTQDGIRIDINLNIGSATQDELSGSMYTDGVGLFRTEFLYMSGSTLPTEEEQFREYRKVALEFGEKPVILRTLDIGGDKQLESISIPKEDNPFLGMRALRLCFENLPLFKTQLRAVLRAACFGNLWLMLPMVGSIDDIRRAKAIIEGVKDELQQENVEFNPNVPIGIMIEIPSIALIADKVAKEVDFASIGTNDLCQYLTAVDRLNPTVTEYYQSYHPAMFKLIDMVVSEFNTAGKQISVCGEMGGDPSAATVFIGLGMRKLSMGITSVPQIKKLINELTLQQAEKIAEHILECDTASGVEKYLKEVLSDFV